jgi:hypothetical protein
MTYLRSILVGVAAFMVTVIAFSVITITVMIHFPQLALRIFPGTPYDIRLGELYYMNFPLWQVGFLGVVAFAVAATGLFPPLDHAGGRAKKVY